MLKELRAILDEREQLARRDKQLAADKAGLEVQLIALAKHLGTDIFRSTDLTVTIKSKTRYNVDPQRWEDLYRWCVETNNMQVLQHRATASKFEELVAADQAIPDFVSMEEYDALSPTRNKR